MSRLTLILATSILALVFAAPPAEAARAQKRRPKPRPNCQVTIDYDGTKLRRSFYAKVANENACAKRAKAHTVTGRKIATYKFGKVPDVR